MPSQGLQPLSETEYASHNFPESGKFFTDYLEFLDKYKTERERILWIRKEIAKTKYKVIELSLGLDPQKKLGPSDVFIYTNQHKNICVGVTGAESPLTGSFHCIGSHIDYPHIDLRQNSVVDFSNQGLAAFKTHYYGGLKLFQYANIPMVLKGYCRDASGNFIHVSVGDAEDDPVFTIPDLLIHLMGTDNSRTMTDIMKPTEMLAICMGTRVEKSVEECNDDGADDAVNLLDNSVKKSDKNDKKKKYKNFRESFLQLFNKKYNLNEDSLIYGEWSLFPAHRSRFVGFDKSFIGGPGHDDGSCTFAAVKALCKFLVDLSEKKVQQPKHTTALFMYGYEEIGSTGSAGAKSIWTRTVLEDICARSDVGAIPPQFYASAVNGALQRTFFLSADVTSLYDCNFQSKHDKDNACVAGHGVGVLRYTGARGKVSTSEATAETMAKLLDLVNKETQLQMCMLGEVGVGGGGTIASYIAEQLNCDIIDCGVGVAAMHTPFELLHTEDLWSAMICYKQIIARDN